MRLSSDLKNGQRSIASALHCSRDTIREVRIAAKESASAFCWYRKCSKTHYIRLDFLSRWMFPSPVLEDLPLNPGSVYDRLQLILEHANCKQVRFHDLRHTFATLALQNGMDVKTLSAMLGHVSAATTLDIYTHSTSDMQHAAARKIDCGIGKVELPDEPAPQANAPAIVDFQSYMGKVRKPGTGCISQINDHLFEGRYSPTWIDGKKHARNVYAHTREECEEKLKVLIAEMKAELAELKRQKADKH